MTRNALPLTLAGLLTIAQLAACSSEPTTPRSVAPRAAALEVASPPPTSSVDRDLATLRAATTPFRRYANAAPAGYTFLFMNMCMVDGSSAQRGAMGMHYVNTALLDGKVDVATPEALLYEPRANGERTLVAVEYVIPKDAWTGPGVPRLFGRDFTLNSFDLWALHVWLWKDNPSGLFADWNPTVSCANAGAVNTMKH